MPIIKRSFLCMVLWVAVACTNEPARETAVKSLENNGSIKAVTPVGLWQYRAILDSLGNTVKAVGEQDVMELTDSGTFFYRLAEAEIYATGTWTKTGASALTFSYHDLPMGWGADLVAGEYGNLNYYFNNALIRSMNISADLPEGSIGDRWLAEQAADRKPVRRNYRLKKLLPDSMVMEEKGISFCYTRLSDR